MSQRIRSQYRYYVLHKPYGYLCQFSGETSDLLLGDLYQFPKDVYSIGRLDKDSEGLLILTNDNKYKTKLLSPNNKEPKTYWVQVEGEITSEAIQTLSNGSIVISHKGKKHQVSKAHCAKIEPPSIEERTPPIRFRKNIPTSWISLTITEGKNRQVRKMTAAVNFPTLRLIRSKMGGFSIKNLAIGEVTEVFPKNR
ncbi:MAG: pseudouridine synthase [Crocinitomicaceae bacterium]|nr:pseudouridine synthase [Crocinitomicaceae bacterium]